MALSPEQMAEMDVKDKALEEESSKINARLRQIKKDRDAIKTAKRILAQ